MIRITGVIKKWKMSGQPEEEITIEASGDLPSEVASDYNAACRVLNPSLKEMVANLSEAVK